MANKSSKLKTDKRPGGSGISFLSGSEPRYIPDEWNHPDIVEKFNCYDYAFNNKNPKQIKKSQPGDIAGIDTRRDKSPLHQCNILHTRISYDHPMIYAINYDESCKTNFYKIGTFVAQRGSKTERDYHFIRQDDNDLWSHKLGEQSTSQLDAKKQLINDPRTADLNYKNYQYKDLCGFYCIPKNSNKKFLHIKKSSKENNSENLSSTHNKKSHKKINDFKSMKKNNNYAINGKKSNGVKLHNSAKLYKSAKLHNSAKLHGSKGNNNSKGNNSKSSTHNSKGGSKRSRKQIINKKKK